MALETLKGFFKKNLKEEEQELSSLKENHSVNEDAKYGKKEQESYEDWGFSMARKQQGNPKAYEGCWGLVKEYFRKKEKENIQQQQVVIDKAKSELELKETQKTNKNNFIEDIKERINGIKEKINELKKDIFRIKENPETVSKDKIGKVGFIIGVVILSGLTLYLFMFYSSATYSALFKEFTADDDKLSAAIFDAQAISKAFSNGLMEFILILTIPFAFLGLGYLIHKFQEQEGMQKNIKVGGLILITFLFDVILAFEITEKIYEIKRAGSFQDMEEYSISLAFQSPQFWVIIFAGFVVYLIWGFVFDFTMEAYDKLDIVQKAIQTRESEIKLLEEDIKTHNEQIDNYKKEIATLDEECIPLRKIINGDTFVINWERFFQCVGEFTTGWTHWMSANKIEENLIDDIHHISDDLRNQLKKSIKNNS